MELNLIETNPDVMMGKPVVAGTRITVELILEKLPAGETVEQFLDAHPRLTRQAVSAALLYAVQSLPTYSAEAAGETATFFSNIHDDFWRAWWQFRPAYES